MFDALVSSKTAPCSSPGEDESASSAASELSELSVSSESALLTVPSASSAASESSVLLSADAPSLFASA